MTQRRKRKWRKKMMMEKRISTTIDADDSDLALIKLR